MAGHGRCSRAASDCRPGTTAAARSLQVSPLSFHMSAQKHQLKENEHTLLKRQVHIEKLEAYAGFTLVQ